MNAIAPLPGNVDVAAVRRSSITSPPVRGTWPLRIVRAFALFALTAGLLLWVDDAGGGQGLCRFDGCGRVHASNFSRPLGLPLPVVGALGFGVVFSLSTVGGRLAARWLRLLAVAGGVAGATLIGVQLFIIHDLCPWCVAVDSAAVLLALVAGIGLCGKERPPALGPVERGLCLAGGGMALLLPAAVWTSAGLVQAPPEVKRLWQPDRVNVVEIADFACPHCRCVHRQLQQLLADQGDRVHFVVLSGVIASHRHSKEAALAYRAAEALGKGPAMAKALFAADDLSNETCERLAISVGLSPTAYRARALNPALAGHLASDLQWMQAATPRGLPAIWVQDRLLVGESIVEELEPALRQALQSGGHQWPRLRVVGFGRMTLASQPWPAVKKCSFQECGAKKARNLLGGPAGQRRRSLARTRIALGYAHRSPELHPKQPHRDPRMSQAYWQAGYPAIWLL